MTWPEMGSDNVGGHLTGGEAARGSETHQVKDENREGESSSDDDQRNHRARIGAQ